MLTDNCLIKDTEILWELGDLLPKFRGDRQINVNINNSDILDVIYTLHVHCVTVC